MIWFATLQYELCEAGAPVGKDPQSTSKLGASAQAFVLSTWLGRSQTIVLAKKMIHGVILLRTSTMSANSVASLLFRDSGEVPHNIASTPSQTKCPFQALVALRRNHG